MYSSALCKLVITAVTTNTRPWRVFFFSLFEPEFSWTSINCFLGFARAGGDREDREGSLIAEWRAKTYNNNFERRRLFKLFLLRWRITLLKQWVLCELSEIAELNVLPSAREKERESSLGQRVKNDDDGWSTSTKTHVSTEEKTFWGRVLVVTAVMIFLCPFFFTL